MREVFIFKEELYEDYVNGAIEKFYEKYNNFSDEKFTEEILNSQIN
jgi:hypothetical protein